MHYTALATARLFLSAYVRNNGHKTRVLDIGSLDINGSIRSLCDDSFDYIGVDFADGPGVDVVIDDPYKLPFDEGQFDIVISSSCFEHSEFFWLSFLEAIRVLKPSGLLYINAPSNAAFHRYPVDCWRFYPDSGEALAKWGRENGFNCCLCESFISDQKNGRVNDFVCVLLKDKDYINNFPSRIVDIKKDFTNGRTDKSEKLINLEWETEDHRKYPFSVRLKRAKRKIKNYLSKSLGRRPK